MRVVTAEPVRRTPALSLTIAPRERHRAHVESIALAVTTIVIALGLWLAWQQLSEVGTANAGAALIDLNRAAESTLASALTVFPTAAKRDFAAHAIAARVNNKGPHPRRRADIGQRVREQHAKKSPSRHVERASGGIVARRRGRRVHRR